MPRPRTVYDPFNGSFDRKRSSEGAVRRVDEHKGEWVAGVFVVSDSHYIVPEDPGQVLGFGQDAIDRGRLQPIRGTRVA